MKQKGQQGFQLCLWIVRHGQTEGNKLQILQGQDGGVLSDLGVRQAEALGKRLQNELFDRVYVSDLARTMQTFEGIKKCHTAPIEAVPEPLLREKHAGTLQGKSLALPKQLAQKEGVDIRKFRPPQGESWEDVHGRAKTFYQKLQQECQNCKKILIVSHGGFIMEFMNHMNYIISKKAPTYNNSATNCSITIVQLKGTSAQIVVQNDSSHLQKVV